MVGQDLAARLGRHRRRSGHLRAERLHDRTAVRLLFVTDFDHVDSQFETERLGRVRQRGAPLARAGFGRDVGNPLLFAEISLRDGRIQLVRPYRADTFVLKIDMRRSAQRLFQLVSPYQRRTTVVLVLLPDRLRNVDPRVGLVHLLIGQRFGEDRIEIRSAQRLAGLRIERRHRLVRHVGRDIVPLGRNFAFRKDKSFRSRAHIFYVLNVCRTEKTRAVVSSTALCIMLRILSSHGEASHDRFRCERHQNLSFTGRSMNIIVYRPQM